MTHNEQTPGEEQHRFLPPPRIESTCVCGRSSWRWLCDRWLCMACGVTDFGGQP